MSHLRVGTMYSYILDDMTLISTDIFVTHIKDIPDITISFAEI